MVRKLTVSLVFPVLLTACQTYDFEPVTPLAVAQTTQSKNVIARQLKPNLMILVDKSGSMLQPTDPTAAGCPAGCGPSSPCPSGCPTRISELRSAMGTFLTTSGTVARMGLGFFPSDAVCGPTGAIDVSLPAPTTADDSSADAANTANATSINGRIQAVAPLGGTPTGSSLAFVGGTPGLNDINDNRQDFVLLLTDGLPNCNSANPNNQCAGANPNCRCTTSGCSGSLCALGCLDRAGAIDNVQQLRGKQIKTIVVGFGADTATGDAPDVLNAMAEAGGFARTCPNHTNAECGTGGQCLAGDVCDKKFYQAKNGAELSQALTNISNILGQGNPCEFPLEAQPSNPKVLTVIVDGVVVPACSTGTCDTWTYVGGKVIFQGAKCDQIKNATPAKPVKVEIRIVEQL